MMDNVSAVRAFEDALAAYAKNPENEDLQDLHCIFTDQTEHPEVMWGLVHFLETFDQTAQLSAFIEKLPEMVVEARSWAETIIFRILNYEPSRIELPHIIHLATDKAKQSAYSLLSSIKENEKGLLKDHAATVLKELGAAI